MEVQALPARWTPCRSGNRHYVRACATPGDTTINECGNRMMNQHLYSRGFTMRGLPAALALTLCCSTAALSANSISGSVRNQSRGEPAAGDDVILVRLDGRLQEEARAKTDAHGVFTLDAQHPDKPYMVRVFHQGVSYDQQASVGQVLSIQVFDAAPEVRGITGTIEILRTGTNGNFLHVSDMIEIKNASRPPLTQAGERTFEVYLAAAAKIDSVLASGPGKIAAIIFAAPVPGEPGHYTVDFPLRPGATKFAFNYDLPYRGHAAFQTRHPYPLRQFAVMIPRTMKFSSRSPAFEVFATSNTDYQVRAITQLKAGEGPSFAVSGTGALPPIQGQAKPQAHAQSPPKPPTSAQVRPPLHSSPRLASGSMRPQSSSQSLVLGALTAILLVACVFLIWRTRKARRITAQ